MIYTSLDLYESNAKFSGSFNTGSNQVNNCINFRIHVCFLKGLLGFTYHSLASKRGNGKKYETFVPRTTVGIQYKLFQSLDRRETIIVFRLNGHQTKFVCEVLVLGIRKKSIGILRKERGPRLLKYSNQRNKMALEFTQTLRATQGPSTLSNKNAATAIILKCDHTSDD